MKNATITEVPIDTDFIELNKLLKLADLVSSGGEAKWAISNGMVQVNNEVATQIRRKIHVGDEVIFNAVRVRPVK